MLDSLPLRELSADVLPQLRASTQGRTSPAPAGPDVGVVEHFIPVLDGFSLRVLVYTPKTPLRTGALLWLHGGGTVQGTPDQNEPRSRYLAQLAGCVVVVPQYRLAPENPCPAALEDCFAALQWLSLQAEELNFFREKIAVAGESGGRCLAAGLILLSRDRGTYPISALFYNTRCSMTARAPQSSPRRCPQKASSSGPATVNAFLSHSVLGKRPGSVAVPVYAAPGRAVELVGFPNVPYGWRP